MKNASVAGGCRRTLRGKGHSAADLAGWVCLAADCGSKVCSFIDSYVPIY